jgi:hypothetical protein
MALQCDSIGNDAHGHDSCLEGPFVDFGVVSKVAAMKFQHPYIIAQP